MGRTTTLQRSLRIAVPRAWGADEKGAFLEDIAKQALRRQSYSIIERIRFTGMEIDLLGTHKPSGDPVYIECKFYEKNLSANVLDLMVGQSFRRRISRVALFSASPLSKEAKGALEELKRDDRVSFSFYGPEQMLESLVDGGVVPLINSVSADVSHATLFIHPEHDYFWLLQEQQDGRPGRLIVYGISDKTDTTANQIRSIFDEHDILGGLPVVMHRKSSSDIGYQRSANEDIPPAEVVSRVGTADNLIDYRPCNPSHFVGRSALQKEILDFLGSVKERRTDTRLIALVGASGYGKSSLVARLAERFRNKKWRTSYFLFPVDVRSARGPLFVAEALLAAIASASDSGFIEAPEDLQVEDVDNILSGPSVNQVLEQLKADQKVLVVFFDQFEEAFTKDELFPVFRAFRRLALDANARKENIVLGFSWRTGISLSDDNPAYQLWNELRDYRVTKTLEQFDSSESSRIISQFESVLNQKLLPPLRRQLHEQGQGLPWFLKKLCIHVYSQVSRGVSQVDLVGSRLNVQSLFDEDLEPLNEAQISCLRHIAANSPVDSLEVYERYGTEVVNELSDRRLIVRAGQRFAVYWDIFRDYLTEGKVPHIPWTYIPNSTLHMALSVCDVLAERGPSSAHEVADALSYSERTIVNIVTDLQNLVICGKNPDGKHILLSKNAPDAIPERMHSQFSDHILYQRLLEVSGDKEWLSQEQGVGVVRALYSSANVKAKTRDKYFSRLFPWFEFAGLVETASSGIRIIPPNKRGNGFGRAIRRSGRAGRGATFLGGATPDATLELLQCVITKGFVERPGIAERGWRNAAADLVALGLTWWGKDQLNLVSEFAHHHGSTAQAVDLLVERVQGARTIELLDHYLTEESDTSRADLGLRIAEALGRDWKRSSALRYANGLIGYREFLLRRIGPTKA